MIYFIRPETDEPIELHPLNVVAGRPIKIGSTLSPRKRLLELQQKHDRPDLAIIGMMPGGILVERSIQEQFSHLRNRFSYAYENGKNGNPQTEWFEAGDDLLEFIEANASDFDVKRIPRMTPLLVTNRYRMWVEQIAAREGKSVEKLLWEAMRDHIERRDSGRPPTKGKPSLVLREGWNPWQ